MKLHYVENGLDIEKRSAKKEEEKTFTSKTTFFFYQKINLIKI